MALAVAGSDCYEQEQFCKDIEWLRKSAMKILLNFSPLKLGGGVQVGLDFLSNIGSLGKEHQWYLICTESTPFHEAVLPGNCLRVKVLPRSLIARLFFENFNARKLVDEYQIDVVYTQFGPPLPNMNVRSVVGCAYSNLFYPEVDFWAGNSILKKIERYLFDYVRLRSLRHADVVVFETRDLAERAVRQHKLKVDQSRYVLPAVSGTMGSGSGNGSIRERLAGHPAKFKLCTISSYGRHKNFEKLVDILYLARERYGRSDFAFVLTLPHDHRRVCDLMAAAKAKGVDGNVINIGPIPYDACAEVYDSVDAAILLSRLESFSNNIAEAWATRKPLIISDLDWARSLCGDGALYVDIDDLNGIVESLIRLADDAGLQSELAGRGKQRLESFPRSSQRFSQYLKIIEGAVP